MSNKTNIADLDGRSTFGLVVSCLATVFICVYTTLRLNMPPKGAGGWWVFKHKLGWVLMGIFAPELVVITAWLQWMSARKLTEKIKRHLNKQKRSRDVEWTMTHSYYAQMGGFIFGTNDPGEDPYIPGSPSLYLTANGAVALAEMGRLPLLSEKSIIDKSKVDGLGKTIVVIQASWFILRCLARVAARLPLTCLELSTLIHVACAFVIYFLWRDKPLDIRDPTIISGSWRRPIVAAMWMFSHPGTIYNPQHSSAHSPEIESLLYIERFPPSVPHNQSSPMQTRAASDDAATQMQSAGRPENEREVGNVLGEDPDHLMTKISPSGTEILRSHRGMVIKLLKEEFLLPFGFGLKASSNRFKRREVGGSEIPIYDDPPVEIVVDFMTLTRWQLAQQCMKEYPEIWDRYKKEIKPTDGKSQVLFEYPEILCRDSFVNAIIPNWPGPTLIQPGNSYSESPLLFSTGCFLVYGALHAVAWNYYFPTSDERWLWRFSSLFIAGSVPLYLLMDAARKTSLKIMDNGLGFNQGFLIGCLGIIQFLLFIPFGIVWHFAAVAGIVTCLVSRFFIIIEPFLGLRDLPAAVYQTPKWSQYFGFL